MHSSDLDTADAVADLSRRLVAGAFQSENTDLQGDRDPTQLSMSGIGGCTRACAYSVAGTPPSDVAPPEQARMAVLGVWIHLHLLPRMARLAGPDTVVEQPVKLSSAGLIIPGTLDMAMPEVVWDLKSVREWRLHGVRRKGTFDEHRVQVMGYALARYQAGYPVKWVVWLYLDRSTGEVHVEVERFTNAAALAVVDRLAEIRYHSADPDRAPREGRGPGLSLACDRCPWLRRCWGPDAVPGEPGAQRSQAATIEGIEEALALYAQGAELESDGKKLKEFAKLVVAEVGNGTYGRWSLARGRPGSQMDQKAVVEDYAARGIPVPKMPTAGRLLVNPVGQQEV